MRGVHEVSYCTRAKTHSCTLERFGTWEPVEQNNCWLNPVWSMEGYSGAEYQDQCFYKCSANKSLGGALKWRALVGMSTSRKTWSFVAMLLLHFPVSTHQQSFAVVRQKPLFSQAAKSGGMTPQAIWLLSPGLYAMAYSVPPNPRECHVVK